MQSNSHNSFNVCSGELQTCLKGRGTITSSIIMKQVVLYVAHHNIQVFYTEGYNGYAYTENCNVFLTSNHLFVLNFIVKH
jgi:hypothetical protein